jgi:hypothetical protein
MELYIIALLSGAGSGASTFTFGLPSGYVGDSTKYVSGSTIGTANTYSLDAATQYKTAGLGLASTTTINLLNDGAGGSYIGTDLRSDTQIYIHLMIPIVGWSSSVIMSSDADTRVVAARYTLTSSTGNSSFADATDEIVDFDTKDFDTHGAVTTGVSWKFTAPISGIYNVSTLATWNATTNLNSTLVKLYKNGAEDRRVGFGKTEDTIGGTTLISLLAGEYINIILNQDDSASAARAIYTGANSGRFTWIEVNRVGNY